MGKPNDDFSDDFVASLLSKEATEKNIRYSALGLQAFHPKRSTSNAPKPNTRFLRNIIREADSHNAALLAKEAEESKERLRILRIKERAARTGNGESSRTAQRPDRELYRVGAKREVPVAEGRKRRRSRSKEQEATVVEERKRRRSRSRERIEERKRRYSKSDGKSRSRSPDKERRRYRKRSRSGERRRSSSRSQKHRHQSSRNYSDKNRDQEPAKHRDRDRDRGRGRDRERGKDTNPFSTTTSHTSKHRHRSPPLRHAESSRSRSRRRKRRKEMEMDSPPPSSSHSTSSDPFTSIIGPAPPAPPSRARGRGKANGASAMDARFSADYDPSMDVRPDSDAEGDDWDNAIEAYRDRQKWKALGAERLRSAGFGEDYITAWENNDTKNEANIKWAKDGVREWDRGKVVEDGEVKVRASWTQGGG